MKKNKVSVVMSARNADKYISKSIESILNQTFKDFEFIIIDDASTDNTLTIIKEFAKKDKRIKIIINKENIGLTRALNNAISIAKGEYIARQDADDYSAPERLETQILFLEKNNNISLVGTSVTIIDEAGTKLCERNLPTGSEQIKAILQKDNCIFHGTILFRKKDVLEIGAYRPFFTKSQDYDLYLRLCETKNIDNINKPLYFWRFNDMGISANNPAQHAAFRKLALRFADERKKTGNDSYSEETIKQGLNSIIDGQNNRRTYEYQRAIFVFQGTTTKIPAQNIIKLFFKYPSLTLFYFYYSFKAMLRGIKNTL